MLVANKYRLHQMISEGGFSRVYLAHHIHLLDDNARVIKVIKPEVFEQPGMDTRFYREVRITASLSQRNEHIVRIYDDFGEESQLGYYYVMEYLQGLPLSKYGTRPLPLGTALAIFDQLCDAISEAHDAAIIHRDLKPDNIYLIHRHQRDNFVKILDFGIAKPLNTTTQHNLTLGAIGTPHYMAPEQCLAQEVCPGTDIYAMGLILYELLTGRLPFNLPEPSRHAIFSIFNAHISLPPISLRQHQPQLSEDIEQILFQALAKSPTERFASVTEFQDALKPYLAANPTTQLDLDLPPPEQSSHKLRHRLETPQALVTLEPKENHKLDKQRPVVHTPIIKSINLKQAKSEPRGTEDFKREVSNSYRELPTDVLAPSLDRASLPTQGYIEDLHTKFPERTTIAPPSKGLLSATQGHLRETNAPSDAPASPSILADAEHETSSQSPLTRAYRRESSSSEHPIPRPIYLQQQLSDVSFPSPTPVAMPSSPPVIKAKPRWLVTTISVLIIMAIISSGGLAWMWLSPKIYKSVRYSEHTDLQLRSDKHKTTSINPNLHSATIDPTRPIPIPKLSISPKHKTQPHRDKPPKALKHMIDRPIVRTSTNINATAIEQKQAQTAAKRPRKRTTKTKHRASKRPRKHTIQTKRKQKRTVKTKRVQAKPPSKRPEPPLARKTPKRPEPPLARKTPKRPEPPLARKTPEHRSIRPTPILTPTQPPASSEDIFPPMESPAHRPQTSPSDKKTPSAPDPIIPRKIDRDEYWSKPPRVKTIDSRKRMLIFRQLKHSIRELENTSKQHPKSSMVIRHSRSVVKNYLSAMQHNIYPQHLDRNRNYIARIAYRLVRAHRNHFFKQPAPKSLKELREDQVYQKRYVNYVKTLHKLQRFSNTPYQLCAYYYRGEVYEHLAVMIDKFQRTIHTQPELKRDHSALSQLQSATGRFYKRAHKMYSDARYITLHPLSNQLNCWHLWQKALVRVKNPQK
jgi:serine/threonine protein kinase